MSLQNLPGGAGSEPLRQEAQGAPAAPEYRDAATGDIYIETGEERVPIEGECFVGVDGWFSTGGVRMDMNSGIRKILRKAGLPAPEPSLGEGSHSLPAAPRRMRVRITKAGQPTYWYADKIGQEFLVEVSAHALESSFFVVPLTGETGARIIGRDDCEFLTFPVPAAPAALAPSVPKGGDEDELIADLRDALQAMVYTVNAAGVLNLSNGVQLGQTSWAIKMDNALIMARAALSKLEGR